MKNTDPETCVIRVGGRDGNLKGTGFLITPTLAVTCAHVVRAFGAGQGERVRLVFRAGGAPAEAEVLADGWHPDVDVAFLRLTAPLPEGAAPAVLGPSEGRERILVEAFGYPNLDDIEGLGGDGRLIRRVATKTGQPLLQLGSTQITSGFSGGPVWDAETGHVIGMVTRAAGPDKLHRLGDVAFAIPSEALRDLRPGEVELQHQDGSPFHPNPFTPLSGRIDDPARVFGRDREIARALDLLDAGSSVALIGPAGVGKSSLLTKLMALFPDRLGTGQEIVYLNLQLVHDEEDFYEALCGELDLPTCRGIALSRALRGRRVLLCLDEMEKMTWAGFGHGLRAQLRGLAEGDDAPLKLILAARTPLDRLFPDSEGMTSPLANVCLQVDVAPWEEETARAFLAARLAATGIAPPEDVLTGLVARSGGLPARLMQAAFDLYAELTRGAL